MKISTSLVALSATLLLIACSAEPEEKPLPPAETPATKLTGDEKMVVDTAFDQGDIDQLFVIYQNSGGVMKKYAGEKIGQWLESTTNADKVDDLYWQFRRPSGVRQDLIDAQERLNPNRT